MSPSGPTGETRVSVAPPVEATKSRRASYLALMASGLLTATAFAGIAVVAGQTAPIAGENVQQFQRQPSGHSGGGLVQGTPSPEQTTIKISGAAHGGDRVPSSTTTTNDETTDPTTSDTTETPNSPSSTTGSSTSSSRSTTTTKTQPDPTTDPEPDPTTDPEPDPTTDPDPDPCPEGEQCEPEDPPGGGASTTSSPQSSISPGA